MKVPGYRQYWLTIIVFSLAPCSFQAAHVNSQTVDYRWQAGDVHNYCFTIDSEYEETKIRISGDVELRVKGPVADWASADGQPLPAAQNGWGLLISPNHLVTSMDLVDQADQIDITIKEKTVSAKTLVMDEISGLTLLELSNPCEFSQPSLAIGLSLSPQDKVEILDSSSDKPRILVGTVTGYRSQNGRRSLFVSVQQDASLLGAPVVDRQGNIIGLISGQRAGSPGHWVATPADEIQTLSVGQAIELSKLSPRELSTNEAVIENFQPNLTPVNVVRNATPGSLNRIEFSASYTTNFIRRGRFPFPEFPERASDAGNLLVSRSGHVIRFEGEEHLPFLLGPLGSFPIEWFGDQNHDGSNKESWELEIPTSLATVQRDGPFGIYAVAPFIQDRTEKIISTTAATEKVKYQIFEVEPPVLKINKTYELVTLDHQQRPSFRFTGTGSVQFDSQLGVIVANEFTGAMERNTKNVTVRMPVKINLRRRTPEQIAAQRKLAADRAEALRIERETPLTETEMSKVMEDLKSGEMSRQMQAMLQLVRKTPKQGNSELAQFLIDRANDQQITRIHYRQVLEKWATPEIGPKLLELIPKTDDSFLRSAMIGLVAKFETPGAVEVLAPRLSSRHDRHQVERLLMKSGAAAEEPTLKHLDDPDRWVRRSAIAVLAEVGTKNSLETLEKIASDDQDHSLQYAAQRAVQAIKSRQ